MLKKLGFQVVLVLAGALLSSAAAQTTTVGTISGTIRDEKARLFPRPKSIFRAWEPGSSELSARTRTDSIWRPVCP